MRGKGDHTYMETIILDANEFRRIKEAKLQLNQKSTKQEDHYLDTLDNLEAANENETNLPLPDGFHEVNLIDKEEYE